MATVFDVATYILEKHAEPYGVNTMKLQKLVYYCQAWHMVRTGNPLFNERIEAWAAGPVVRALYARHRLESMIDKNRAGGNSANVTPEERVTIDGVIGHYGGLSAVQLSELTHAELPWQEARQGLAPTERGTQEISPQSMFDYYTALARGR